MSIKKLFVALVLAPTLAFAWEPTKPVTVSIGNTPGAGNEMAFRKLAQIVQKENPKFVFVVQNIPGADSVIANNKFLPIAEKLFMVLYSSPFRANGSTPMPTLRKFSKTVPAWRLLPEMI